MTTSQSAMTLVSPAIEVPKRWIMLERAGKPGSHGSPKVGTLQGTNISPKNGILKMIFLFPRWDMLVPWRVFVSRCISIYVFPASSFLPPRGVPSFKKKNFQNDGTIWQPFVKRKDVIKAPKRNGRSSGYTRKSRNHGPTMSFSLLHQSRNPLFGFSQRNCLWNKNKNQELFVGPCFEIKPKAKHRWLGIACLLLYLIFTY